MANAVAGAMPTASRPARRPTASTSSTGGTERRRAELADERDERGEGSDTAAMVAAPCPGGNPGAAPAPHDVNPCVAHGAARGRARRRTAAAWP